MENTLVSAWTDEQLKEMYVALAGRAETWTDADRHLLEQIVLERVKRSQRDEWIDEIRQRPTQG